MGRRAEHRKTEKLYLRGSSAKVTEAYPIFIFFLSLYNSLKRSNSKDDCGASGGWYVLEYYNTKATPVNKLTPIN